jgi:hypothetical protein
MTDGTAGETKTGGLTLEEAFARSRTGSIVLAVLAVLTATQMGLVLAATPPDLFGRANAGNEEAQFIVGTTIYVVVYVLIAVVAAVFAWLKRSRIAMIVGLLLLGVNWVTYFITLAQGDFDLRGVIFTVVGTALLIRALQAAVRYHALKGPAPPDGGVVT